MKGDFHIHTTGSDGVLPVELIYQLASEKGFSHIAITDHFVIADSIKTDEHLAIKKKQYGLDIIIGMEQGAYVNGELVHLLCYFNSNNDLSEVLMSLMKEIEVWVKDFNEAIKSVMWSRGVDVPDIDYTKLDSRSFTPILMEVVKRTGDTPKEIRKEFSKIKDSIGFREMPLLEVKSLVEEVHKSKGLIVMAHPYEYKWETMLEVVSYGIDGLEAYYPAHTEDMTNRLLEVAGANNLIVTAGSDFHNPVDAIRHGSIGDVGLSGKYLNAFLRRLKGEPEMLKMESLITKYLTEFGADVKKDSVGDHYFVEYRGKHTVVTLVDMGLNSTMFKLNSSKEKSMSILDNYNIPHVEVIALSKNNEEATEEAVIEFKKAKNYGKKIVIRGDKGTCGELTYFIDNKDHVYQAVAKIIDKGVKPLISPYYDCKHEYRVFVLGDKIELVVRKDKNELTGKHNLSLGSHAEQEKNSKIINDLGEIALNVAELFDCRFVAVDILATEEGYKVIEFGIPNAKRFAYAHSDNNEMIKTMYQKALLLKLGLDE